MWGAGKMKMKQVSQLLTLSLVILYILSLAASAIALTKYTGQPGFPYLVFGSVILDGEQFPGAEIQIENTATGYNFIVKANADGYWQEDSTNWLTNNKLRTPVMFGDVIQLTAITGCADGDVCVKTFSAFDTGYTVKAQIDFTLTGEAPVVEPEPEPTPPSPGGSSGGGGGTRRRSHDDGSGDGSGVKWTCGGWFACTEINTQIRVCDDTRGNTKQESQSCVYSKAPIAKKSTVKDEVIVVPPVVTEPVKPVKPDKPKPLLIPDIPDDVDSIYFEAIVSLFVLVSGALGLKWRWQFIGLARYWWNKGHKMRAIKMFLTATKRAKEDFYSKKKE